jgi:fatty-acyl-CoA synthase
MGVGLFPILMGATTVSTYSPDLARMVEMMAKYKTTYTVLTPTIYLRLFHTEGIKEAATSMRKFLTFGATIPERMITKGREIAPHIQWVSLYALSEPTCCGAVGLFKTINEIPEGDLGWVGKPAPSLEMRIVDDNNNDVPVGDVGELVFRGPVVMKEYYKQPELTAKVFDSGWFHTGDLGRLNKNGELFFVDRKKDMIKSGGENISTASVEYAISSYPKVSEVAVFGVPHPEWMEASVAAVIPIQNEYLAEEEIIQYCKQNLPRFKVPKYVLIVNDFPRNPTGKILKRELREQYKDIASQGQ